MLDAHLFILLNLAFSLPFPRGSGWITTNKIQVSTIKNTRWNDFWFVYTLNPCDIYADVIVIAYFENVIKQYF